MEGLAAGCFFEQQEIKAFRREMVARALAQ
jgi:hypothetical protein